MAAIEQSLVDVAHQIRSQLAPPRALAMAEDARRERGLATLLAEAREELSRLKATNRSLVAELAGNPLSSSRKSGGGGGGLSFSMQSL
uniref:Uncharacterized protein n=1 Tax=Haptolina ericina TaxID=156174 RepID=A0A7S3AM85_9EUKA